MSSLFALKLLLLISRATILLLLAFFLRVTRPSTEHSCIRVLAMLGKVIDRQNFFKRINPPNLRSSFGIWPAHLYLTVSAVVIGIRSLYKLVARRIGYGDVPPPGLYCRRIQWALDRENNCLNRSRAQREPGWQGHAGQSRDVLAPSISQDSYCLVSSCLSKPRCGQCE